MRTTYTRRVSASSPRSGTSCRSTIGRCSRSHGTTTTRPGSTRLTSTRRRSGDMGGPGQVADPRRAQRLVARQSRLDLTVRISARSGFVHGATATATTTTEWLADGRPVRGGRDRLGARQRAKRRVHLGAARAGRQLRRRGLGGIFVHARPVRGRRRLLCVLCPGPAPGRRCCPRSCSSTIARSPTSPRRRGARPFQSRPSVRGHAPRDGATAEAADAGRPQRVVARQQRRPAGPHS